MSTARKWSPSIQWPTASDYKLRILDAVFGPSAKGNPMITLSLEVESPEEMEVAGEKFTVAGQQLKYYITTGMSPVEGATDEQSAALAEKIEKMRKGVVELLSKMGMKEEQINWDNIDTTPLKGKLIFSLVDAKPDERRKNPTAAQIAAAKAKGEEALGDIMKDPMTGQPLVTYWPKIVTIFGLVPGSATVGNQF